MGTRWRHQHLPMGFMSRGTQVTLNDGTSISPTGLSLPLHAIRCAHVKSACSAGPTLPPSAQVATHAALVRHLTAQSQKREHAVSFRHRVTCREQRL